VWEFADPEAFARAIAATGPGYEAIEAVGEARFLQDATQLAEAHLRDGLPLRAEIDLAGLVAHAPIPETHGPSFLAEPVALDTRARAIYDADLSELGYVMNVSRLWANDPEAFERLFQTLGHVTRTAGLSIRDRGILVTATASTLTDSYCSLAWGRKLAAATTRALSVGVLTGDDSLLDERERALAAWARAVIRDPNAISASDVQKLRDAGYSDAQILAITTYIGLRIAFSTVNDALGASPDWQLLTSTPTEVHEAVTYGRSPARPPDPQHR